VRNSLTVAGAIASRKTIGATGGAALAKQLSDAAADIKAHKLKISTQIKSFSEMMSQ
jgi:argininosuccinate lyase